MIEKKLKSLKSVPVKHCGSGGFILRTGEVIVTTDHAATCRSLGYTLEQAIEEGVCRYMLREGRQGMVAAFEYSSLTDVQKRIILAMLRQDDYYVVITEKRSKVSETRPIRSIEF